MSFSYCSWGSQHMNTGVVCHSLLQWTIFSITMIKASGGDGIPADLFQILKDDAVKVLQAPCQQIWKSQQWPLDWKRSTFITISKKFSSVQSVSRVQLIASPWTTACQVSLSITNSWSWSNSRPSSQWCHPTISSSVIPFSSCLHSFDYIDLCQQSTVLLFKMLSRLVIPFLPRSKQSQRKAIPKNVQIIAQLHSSHTLSK